jgi:ADP-heptose:LPS heptosyltransferase
MKKILVIKLGALGDFFSACGTFEKIRAYHPDTKITLLTTLPFKAIATEARYFDEVWAISKPRSTDLVAWIKILKRFITERFDAVYDLQRNDRTKTIKAVSSLLVGQQWLGGPKGGQLSLLNKFTVPAQMLDTRDMAAYPTRDLSWLKGKTAADFGLGPKYVLVVPGCSARHPGKRWPADSYVGLIRLLYDAGFEVAMIGTKEDMDVTSYLKERVAEVMDLSCKTTLADIATLASAACATIGNDTGPIHIAAAAGSPTIVLFSFLSDPAQSAPRYDHVKVFRAENMGDIHVDEVMSCFGDIHK